MPLEHLAQDNPALKPSCPLRHVVQPQRSWACPLWLTPQDGPCTIVSGASLVTHPSPGDEPEIFNKALLCSYVAAVLYYSGRLPRAATGVRALSILTHLISGQSRAGDIVIIPTYRHGN